MMEGRMIKLDIDELGVQERVLLFCLASGTDWKQAGVTFKTVADMWAKVLFTPNYLITSRGGALALTDAGRTALLALLRDI
jgi:hypothetical protein